MNLIKLLPFISSMFVIFLGAYVLSKNYKSKLNTLFILFCLSISIWLFGTYKMFISKTDNESIFWDRFIYIGVVFIPIFMHHFSIVFCGVKNQGKLLFGGYILAIVFLIVSRTDYFAKGLYHYKWGCHTIAQPAHHIFLLVFWGYVILLNYNIYHFYKTTKSSVEKNQSKYIFIAFMLLFLIGACAYLPAYKIPIFPFPFSSGVIFTIILAYAIAKHRLLDVHFVIRKTLTNTIITILLSSVIIAAFSSKTEFEVKFLLGIIISFVTSIYLPTTKIKLEKWLTRILYKHKYSYLENLEQFSEKMALIPKEEDLLKDTAMVLTRDMYTENVIIFTKDQITGDYNVRHKAIQGIPDDFKIMNNAKVVDWLKRNRRAFVLEEEEKILNINEIAVISEELRPIKAAVCIPARLDTDLIGIIALGNKTTGEMYTHIDLELLERLGIQLAIALDYKRIEAQLRKEQELVAIGQMSLEIGHEIRNLLQSPQTFIDLSLEKIEKNDLEFFGSFRNMAKDRMQVIKSKLDDIMYLGKERPANFGFSVDINKILDENLSANDISIKEEKIEIVKEYSQIPSVKADKNMLTHLFNNLIINAVDAMKESGKEGKIRIRTQNNADLTKEMTDRSKEWIRIEVKDDGVGIPKHVLDKLFTPFVTTKSLGNIKRAGTGLGLSVVKKVVDAHKGYIYVNTAEGKGTTFVIDLPVDLKPAFILARSGNG